MPFKNPPSSSALPERTASTRSGEKLRLEIPLYRQIERYLRHQIESGACKPGDMIPAVDTLRAQFGGVNHLTVRQAIKSLVADGLVESVRGRGTFVTQRAARNRHVALVLPHLDDVLNARIARGAQRVLEAAGLMAVICDSNHEPDKEVDTIHHLRDLPLGGAIIFPIPHGDIAEQLVRMKLEGFPFVLVDRHLEDIAMPAVVVDNYRGSYQMTEHIVKTGRACLAWLGALNLSSSRERLAGFRDALADHGVPLHRHLVIDISDAQAAHQSLSAQLNQLLKSKSPPDAIVFCNDTLAIEGLEILRRKKIAVPSQIAVAGFDDLPLAAHTRPPLTTVHQPMERIGEEAAHLLLERMENPHAAPRLVMLPVEIVVRQSA